MARDDYDDPLNPYVKTRVEAPGERYQRLASDGAAIARLVGLQITPRGRDALAVLIQECEAWWNTNENGKAVSSCFNLLRLLIHHSL